MWGVTILVQTVQSLSTAGDCVRLCVYAPSTIHPLNAFPALNSSFGLDKSLPTNYIMAAASKDIAHGAARHITTQFVTPCLCSQWKVAAIKLLDVGPVGAAVSLKLMLSQLRNLGQTEDASHPPQNSKGLTAVCPTSFTLCEDQASHTTVLRSTDKLLQF